MNRKLETFCRQRKPATLTVGKPARVLQARFRHCSREQDRLVLELIDPPSDLRIEAGHDCTAVFVDGIRTSLFLSRVVEFDPTVRPFQELHVAVPRNLERTELRNTFRIPIHNASQLEVEVICRGKSWKPRALDISVGGLLVEFSESDGFDCSEYDDLDVVLGVAGLEAHLEAVAQPRWNNFWALYFSEVLRGLRHGEATVPAELSTILDLLERDWAGQERLFPESPEMD